jgi:hypothetical protein
MLSRIGYGLPDVGRATRNNQYRITLVTMELMEIAKSEAHIYTVKLPHELRNVGEDYDILLEITLSYASKPKRTRMGTKYYLSTWLDWMCSKKNETMGHFKDRIIDDKSAREDKNDTGRQKQKRERDKNFPWVIHKQANYGKARNFSRSWQTLQKDWCVLKASQLTEDFCVAIRAHGGWGSIFTAKYALAVSFEAVDPKINIYEYIRQENFIENALDINAKEIELK